ncbi:hypothetical protein [Hymenobacter arizonensis]|uniref:Uncharacterized protein n=1 Tax=Hymenobacter arizonensis TaxID=1227077 RepID=A0A1I5TSW5_HYMAR|nr:hypothetical protein [Hymenobacter arizonensis]SFP86113.1 hypothetical protein SAMN04515668_0591 [Hymenobacter arizonensis]
MSTEALDTLKSANKFDNVNKEFIKQIDGLRDTFPVVMLFVTASNANASKALLDFVNSNGIEEKNENNEEYYIFSSEDSHKYSILKRNSENASVASTIIPSSLLVSLVSQFDSFIGKLIKEIFQVKPEILSSSEKSLTFARLLELKSIEEARESLIEKEVETILRDSHTEHFIWLESKLGIPMRKDLPIWQDFIELTERRNLFVHSDGIVSNQYLSVCRQNNVKLKKPLKPGDKLVVNSEYFESAYKCLYELSVKLTQVVWRKILPTDLEKADNSLNEICYDLLQQKHFNISDVLLDFATTTLKKHYNEESKNTLFVNKALSYKLGGNQKACNELVSSKDWSACSDKFKIAKEALLGNHENVAQIMKKLGSEGDIDKASYKMWPLFNDFRETDLFLETYKELFNEDYLVVEAPKKMFEVILSQAAEVGKQKDKYETEVKQQQGE